LSKRDCRSKGQMKSLNASWRLMPSVNAKRLKFRDSSNCSSSNKSLRESKRWSASKKFKGNNSLLISKKLVRLLKRLRSRDNCKKKPIGCRCSSFFRSRKVSLIT